MVFTADRIRTRPSAGIENDFSTSPPASQLAPEAMPQLQAAAGPVWTRLAQRHPHGPVARHGFAARELEVGFDLCGGAV
jgi:hypothetical protein